MEIKREYGKNGNNGTNGKEPISQAFSLFRYFRFFRILSFFLFGKAQIVALRSIVNRPFIVYVGLIAITTVWLVMIFAAPWLLSEGRIIPAVLIYRGFSAVCHQISERSFGFWGHQLGVCSRCLGLYTGFALGLIFYPFLRNLKETAFPTRWILFIASIPMTTDFVLGYLGFWENTFFSRTVTGLIFGSVVAFYILPGFIATFSEYRSHDQTHNYGKSGGCRS